MIANALAMKLAGIDRNTVAPEGGEILKDEQGEPIGVFQENAQELVSKAQERELANRSPAEREADTIRIIEAAEQDCLSKGVTSFQDAGSSFETIDILKRLAQQGKLGIRLWVMIGENNDALAQSLADYRIIDEGRNFLTVRAVKRFMDGALGTRGAWMLEPYSDLPSSTGMNTCSVEDLTETARLAIENGFQLCTHAIGDRANREVLNVYESVFREHPDKTGLRWRIEHAQHLSSADIPRFAKLGVIASMQAIHCTSDAPFVIERLGEKRAAEGAYVWRKLLQSGAVVTNGTDTPVEDVNPIPNFYAAVTRRTRDGSMFFPDQKVTREEALKAYTVSNAYAAFEEDLKGSLEPGKLADITVLSEDIMTVPEARIPEARVLYTIVGGKVAYEKGGSNVR